MEVLLEQFAKNIEKEIEAKLSSMKCVAKAKNGKKCIYKVEFGKRFCKRHSKFESSYLYTSREHTKIVGYMSNKIVCE